MGTNNQQSLLLLCVSTLKSIFPFNFVSNHANDNEIYPAHRSRFRRSLPTAPKQTQLGHFVSGFERVLQSAPFRALSLSLTHSFPSPEPSFPFRTGYFCVCLLLLLCHTISLTNIPPVSVHWFFAVFYFSISLYSLGLGYKFVWFLPVLISN